MPADERGNVRLVTGQAGVACVAAPTWIDLNTDPQHYAGTGFNFGDVPKLGDAQASTWEFRSGLWPVEGLHGTETKSDERVALSLDTPFVAWAVRNTTHLPGDEVLLQLGADQVCVYDPQGRRIALFTRGRGPIAVIQEEKSR